MQTRVPGHLLGRVSSLDWMVSTALIPLSFGLAGPLGEAFGAQAVLIGAGAAGLVLGLAVLLIPGVRDPERAPVAPA